MFEVAQLFFWAFLGQNFAGSQQTIELKKNETRVLTFEQNQKIVGESSSSQGDSLHLGSLILDEGSELQMPAFKSILIQKIIARDGSRIRIADQNSGADGASGVSSRGGDGSRSRVFIADISGHVLIEASGGDGARGIDGRSGKQGLDGADGRRARTLFGGFIYLGNGENGQPGEPGEPGEDGGPGGDGGHGGVVDVFYSTRDSSASIVVNVDGGKGGQGGFPGLGGLGGNGGRGGRGIKDGEQGRLGAQGAHGQSGKSGVPGKPGRAVVLQISPRFFSCLMELEARSVIEVLTDADFEQCRDESETVQDFLSQASAKNHSVVVDENGDINIAADGMDGVSASPAVAWGASSLSGTSGSSGGSVTLLVRELPSRVVIFARGGRGGDGADGVRGRDGADGENGRHPFIFKRGGSDDVGTPGKPGAAGQSGGNGSDGGRGGSGGHVKIVLVSKNPPENWQSHFEVSLSGGLGGIGGKAGLAGHGGKGGTGKTRGKDGPDGVSGRDGSSGTSGDFGILEFIATPSYSDFVIDEFRRDTK